MSGLTLRILQWMQRLLVLVLQRRERIIAIIEQSQPNGFDLAVQRLGIVGDFKNSRSALRAVHVAVTVMMFSWFPAILITIPLESVIFPEVVKSVEWVAHSLGMDTVARGAGRVLKEDDRSLQTLNARSVMYVAPLILLMGVPQLAVAIHAWQRSAVYRCDLNLCVARALESCADVLGRTPQRRPAALRELDRQCRSIEKRILSAYRRCGAIPRRSPRRGPARQHAALVAGMVRIQVARIDKDPDVETLRLAELLVQIGERYASGRTGALVRDEELQGVTPVSRIRTSLRESVRVAATIIAAIVVVVIMNALLPESILPDDLRPWVLGASAAGTAVLVAGWHRVVRILEVFPGR